MSCYDRIICQLGFILSLSGLILLNKPCGITSRDCVNKLVKLLNNKKIGHAGTLDPGATGMLPIFIGRSTKFIRFLVEQKKSYSVVMRLGVKTSTLDNLGEVVATKSVPSFDKLHIESLLEKFIGSVKQTVPLISAVRVNGKRLYEYARSNQDVDLPVREVFIHDIKLQGLADDTLSFDVVCSKGTYVRSLVEDIAAELGTYAHVIELHRNWVAPFENQSMIDMATIIDCCDSHKDLANFPGITNLSEVFVHYPRINLSVSDCRALSYGQEVIYVGECLFNTEYAVFNDDKFFGVVQIDIERKIKVCKLYLL